MSRWSTEAVVRAIHAVRPDALIEVFPRGGDVDTSQLNIATDEATKYDRRILVRGFTTAMDAAIDDPDDCDIEMVEVQDGLDSRGGLVSDDPEVIQLYADVRRALAGMGHACVATLDDYF